MYVTILYSDTAYIFLKTRIASPERRPALLACCQWSC